MKNDLHKKSGILIRQLCTHVAICLTIIFCISLALLLIGYEVISIPSNKKNRSLSDLTISIEINSLDNSKENNAIKYGYALFRESPQYLGPDSKHSNRTYSGNGLSCKNCHLGMGTKPFAAPLIGVIQRFPQFRGRENKIGTIEERINGCMERSMNGRKMPEDSKEMKAMISYLNWLGRFAPKDGKVKGQGFVKIKIPDRAVNLSKGKQVFETNCMVCHGQNGQGMKSIDEFTYEYPPLWGDDSYNNGAGMTRVITAAQFIKANMPFGTTYENPVLTDAEAYDVAGYINQQTRPEKKNRELDFPDLKRKPVSTPYPPYADTFSVEQHRLGPFQPIMEYYKKKHNIKKTK